MSEIDWLSGAAAAPAPAPTPKPKRHPRQPAAAAVPFLDAWLVFRVNGEGMAEDVRVVSGTHLNRLKPGEPRDWSYDIGLHAFGDDPATAWREFLLRWPIVPEQRVEAMREVARIEGLSWLDRQADIYADAVAPKEQVA